LTSRFPFFQSEDDADALIEVAGVFGLREVKECASIHSKYYKIDVQWFAQGNDLTTLLDRTFHTNIPNVPKTRISFLKLCLVLNKERAEQWGDENLRLAVDLLEKVLVLDCNRRISAEDAINHPFLNPVDSKT
jgi:cell division control protein 7